MRRAAFLLAVCLVAFGARTAVGTTLLNEGENAFVLSSDDGDAYDAAARWHAFGTPIPTTDRLTRKWDIATSSVEERWPRGYWLFLASQYRAFGSAYASTIALQAVLGAAGALAAYFLALRVLRSVTSAGIAALLIALSSTGVYLSAALFAEALYIPLLLIGLALATTRAWPVVLIGGLAFGAAELTRPVALPVFAVVLAATRAWRYAACLGIGFAVPLLLAFDPTVFTAGGREAVLDNTAVGAGILDRAATLLVTGGWAPFGEPPLTGVGALRATEMLLALAGAVWLIRSRPTPEAWLVIAVIAAILVPPLLIGLPLVRYRAPADPLLIMLMCAAAQAAWSVPAWRARLPRWSASPSLS